MGKQDAQKIDSSTKAENKVQKEKKKEVSKRDEGGTKNIIVAAIIILLLLTGIGLLIFGIMQSVTNGGDKDNDSAVESLDEGDGDTTDIGNSGKDGSDDKDNKDSKDAKDGKDGKDSKDGKNGDAKDSKDAKASQDGKDSKDGKNGSVSSASDSKGDSDTKSSDSSSTEGSGRAVEGGYLKVFGAISGEGEFGSSSNSGDSQEPVKKYPPTQYSYTMGNDYNFGQIRGDKYVTKAGDTLWQIAEARYGSGYAWVEIDNANGNFPNLPNGQPVLIPIGYELILPPVD